jgi:hypothetical protein
MAEAAPRQRAVLLAAVLHQYGNRAELDSSRTIPKPSTSSKPLSETDLLHHDLGFHPARSALPKLKDASRQVNSAALIQLEPMLLIGPRGARW